MADDEIYLGSPENPRTAAVVSYITIIGWLLAYYMLYKNNRNSVAAFHLRQSLILHSLFFIVNVLSLFALWHWFPYAIVVVSAALLFILWLMGALGAINGKEKPVPVVGKLAQRVFKQL